MVQIAFSSENSTTKTICSGSSFISNQGKNFHSATIIDKHWFVTSSYCCTGMDNYELIFNSQEKNQWIWGNHQQSIKCKNKRNNCRKKFYRSDDNFLQETYECWSNLNILNNTFLINIGIISFLYKSRWFCYSSLGKKQNSLLNPFWRYTWRMINRVMSTTTFIFKFSPENPGNELV